MVIAADEVTVAIDKHEILKNLTFEVKAGTITGLLGPSGAGKTTLMRAIIGVQSLTNGELHILGDKAGSAQLRKRIGYVSQSASIYTDLTVKENVRYFGAIMSAPTKQQTDVIQQVGLMPQKDQLVDTLSGGQKTRVSLAIALLGNPDILVLDEPTVGLDPVLRRDLWNLFKTMAINGKSFIISSHVMDEAEKCDEILLLLDGEMLFHGTLENVLHKTKTNSMDTAFLRLVENKEAV